MKIFILLVAGAVPAYALSRTALPERESAVFLFAVSFGAAAFFWKEPEVIIDASRYFTQAKHLALYGAGYFFKEWGNHITAWTDLPAVPFLYGLVFKLFGESRLPIQVFTTFLFSMTVVLTYLTGKKLWGEDTGFYAGMLLLGIPYLFSQVPLMLVDVPAAALLMLSVFFFLMSLDRGGPWIALSSAAMALAFFSKYSTWLMLSVLPVVFAVYIVQRTEDRRKIVSRGFATVFIALLLIGAVFWYKYDVFSEQLRFLMSYQKPGLKRWGESFVSTSLFQIHPFITLAAAYSLYAAFKKKDLKYIIICWLVFLVILLQIKRMRYTVMVFPMFALMASYGLCTIRSTELRRFIASYVVIFSFVIALFAYLPFMHKMSAANLKSAGEYLDSLPAGEVEVFSLIPRDPVINPAVYVPIIDLFTNKNIRYAGPGFMPPPGSIETSPLRFTWEYSIPGYYLDGRGGSGRGAETVLVISSGADDVMPGHVERTLRNYRRSNAFKISDDVFTSKVFVTVYRREDR